MDASRRNEHGPYNKLYCANGMLWSARPGRMVLCAAERSQPGRALDLGCGDARNHLFLEQLGWQVDGLDRSPAAIRAARRRVGEAGHRVRGCLRCQDVREAELPEEQYDLVLAYGLYHCLDDQELACVHHKAVRAARPGALFAFAALSDEVPVPESHGTGRLHLRDRDRLLGVFEDWIPVSLEHGVIQEGHEPLLGTHEHAVTWGLFGKGGA